MERRGPGVFLHCCLQVCLLLVHSDCYVEELTNVALNKPATQSSYHDTFGHPEKVVDGNKNTYISYCTHTASTDPSNNHWWRVDLQGLFEVHSVVITNRGDCCGYRLADFDVNVAQSLSNSSRGWQDSSKLCLHRTGQIAQGATESLDCSQPVAGRYVTLVLSTNLHALNFCEMEVLAVPTVPVQRTNTYRNQPRHKAPGDVIRETYVRSVIHCTSTCSSEDGCTAVNLQATSHTAVSGGGRICQLLAFGGVNHPVTVVPDDGWNFYRLKITTETLP